MNLRFANSDEKDLWVSLVAAVPTGTLASDAVAYADAVVSALQQRDGTDPVSSK